MLLTAKQITERIARIKVLANRCFLTVEEALVQIADLEVLQARLSTIKIEGI